ncbi:glycosyltransferase family 15 protein, partial [Sphaerobolus stellatus SS14]
SIRQVGDRFNHKYNDPCIFLNDESFSEEFKSYVSEIIPFVGGVSYGLIPASDWNPPEWTDEERAEKAREVLLKVGAIHGGNNYQNMCKVNSGYFYRREFFLLYRYY